MWSRPPCVCPQDKDIFADTYRERLSKRLLGRKRTNMGLEKYMVSKLKAACGAHLTLKMESMFQDLTVSKQESQVRLAQWRRSL